VRAPGRGLPTEPMPEVRGAIIPLEDAVKALERPAWNKNQMEDKIRSAEFFIDKAKEALK